MDIKAVVMNSIASTHSEGAMEQRRQQINSMPLTYRRIGLQAIDSCIFLIPSLVHRIEHSLFSLHGVTYVGSGAESRVFRLGNTVLKYAHGSERIDEDKKQEIVKEMSDKFNILRNSLAPFVLDQSISIAPHIIRTRKTVVQTEQPYVAFTSFMRPAGDEGGVDMDLSAVNLNALSDFTDRSRALYRETGLLPDTNGLDNVVVAGAGVILIDTQPIAGDNPSLQAIIHRQLDSISRAIDDSSRLS